MYQHFHLYGWDFLANLTPPNKQWFKVKREFKSCGPASNLQTIENFIFGGIAFFF